MEDMESKTVARLIEWLKKHGHTDSEIVECIEFITTGKEKVVWPTDLSVDQFATAGDTVEVTGQIVDYDITVTASVSVVDTMSEVPAPGSWTLPFSDSAPGSF